MNIKSIETLIDYIQQEKGWRTKELLNFKARSLQIKGIDQNSLFKLGICLVYSHWEGFVKNASVAFFTYLIKRGFKYNELLDNYKVCAYLEHFKGYPHKNFDASFKLVTNQINFNTSIQIDPLTFIDTKSNLNYENLHEILRKIGLPLSPFELKAKFLNETLLNFRNAISHGEYRKIDIDEFVHIFDETLILIETFSNELENFSVQKSFFRKNI
ncbi:hypothetical protein D9K79_02980 [Acinetobacter cumulans]|uniref:RiboL-PSP-HEPN domain-containing protein n=1 Tax=Acinetobacter cumulans TaxID=2136182 RepID=A0ABX9UA70_9GAMM|nr:MAE_28990/MAE_18760 family HEPN-like nuclease [Acinetobacter cumulans]RLL49286.1 hypothetical protein D9K79_02980 [Acinetobacter cumulans]